MTWVRSCAAWALAVAMIFSITACSKKRARTTQDTRRYMSERDLRSLPQGNIPIVINERVIAWIEYFQGAGKRHFRRYLQRSSRYLPLMKTILREQGMPTDLVYIALIESGFNNHAYSKAAAVGPWQFIRSTGKMYGLRADGWVDERRDPVRATYAAAKLFRDLYQDYGDWYLAMVGYNAGPGRVNKAMKITGSRDFWVWADHKKALRAETRDYVPKFIAAAIMAKNPAKFGFTNLDYQDAWEHESASVETQTDLSVVAKCAGVDEKVVFDLNPHLLRGATPPGHRDYRVRLPKGTTGKFKVAYGKIPKEERIQIVRHKIRRGDTMHKIARKYGVSTNSLAKANGISRRAKLRRGKTLVIPVGSYAKYAKYGKGSSSSSSGKSKLVRYKVRRGDTLSKIASKYPGVTVSKIKRWNRMGKRTRIRTGQRLKIYTKGSRGSYAKSSSSGGGRKAKYHKVRRGETLGSIARKYGTTTKKLMAMNGIKSAKSLRAGKRIKVRAGRKATSSSGGGGGSATSTYIVKSGDSPGGIASRFGMSTKKLMAINGIKNAKSLKVGQKLKVKGGKGTSSNKSAETTAIAIDDAKAPTGSGATKLEKVRVTKTHRVKRGESVGVIAARYGMSTKKLMAMNGIKNPKRVRAGRKLKVTATTTRKVSSNTTAVALGNASAPKKKTSSKASGTHRVKPGETLGGIAARYHMSTKKLMAINGIKNARRIRVGQKLKVTGKSSSSGSTTAVALKNSSTKTAKASSRTHRVKSGETLGSIAAKYGVSTKQLMAWNGIKNPRTIRAGQKLVVKGGKKSSTSVKKTSSTPDKGTGLKLAMATPAKKKAAATHHRVKNGETLWTIARKHNVTIAQLQKWNNLNDPSAVKAGTSLKIVKN